MKNPFKRTGHVVPKNSPHAQPGSPLSAQKKNVWDNGWQHQEPDEGLPGVCGYLNGIKGETHPSRFVYVRPDGRPDDGPGEADADAPMMPSRRPVPRGFLRS